jgi:glycosyltransferase involved in cell wall biosynthesis
MASVTATSNRPLGRILLFNFFSGVMDRGIPLYTQEIAECLRRVGAQPVELRCPRMLRRAPRFVLHLLYLLFEQVVAPVTRLLKGCTVTVYPYNSAGVVDALLGRSVLVVHDLIPNARGSRSLAGFYIRGTQWVHRALGRPVCAASDSTLTCLRRLQMFRRCPLRLWPNPFYSFEDALERSGGPVQDSSGPPPLRRVLLCSGMGANKDYAGALWMFRHSHELEGVQLRVVGFGSHAPLARRRVRRLPEEFQSRIVVLPRLSMDQLLDEYRATDLVWVHSHHEGFGRFVVEGRLCGRPVVASDITAFRRFAGMGASLYRSGQFDVAVSRARELGAAVRLPTVSAYHAELEASVQEVLRPFA